MNGKRVLVTGGAGFIGSNLCNALVADNHVIALDNCYLGTPDNLSDDVEFIKGSVLDDTLPTDVDVVFHLAALSSYAMHEDEPCRGVRVNVEGFVNVVEQASQDGCDTVVYASTSSIYGSQTTPSSEDMSVAVNTGYEASKMAREKYAEYFSNHYGLSMCGLRFFSVYQGYDGTEEHKGRYANVIAQFADDIANNQSPKLYGDGSQTRDFIHVEDVVRAIELSGEHQLNGVYNVGTGDRHSFNELVENLNTELNKNVDPVYVENPIPESVYVQHTCADSSKLQDAVGWETRIDFLDGVRRVCSGYVTDDTV